MIQKSVFLSLRGKIFIQISLSILYSVLIAWSSGTKLQWLNFWYFWNSFIILKICIISGMKSANGIGGISIIEIHIYIDYVLQFQIFCFLMKENQILNTECAWWYILIIVYRDCPNIWFKHSNISLVPILLKQIVLISTINVFVYI